MTLCFANWKQTLAECVSGVGIAADRTRSETGILVSTYSRLILFTMAILLCESVLHADSAQPFASTQSPHGKLNVPCINCHTTADWKVIQGKIKFDHGQTGFPLRGRHSTVACRDCHADLKFANTPNKCQD